jgi:hypothetical protein
LHDNLRRSLLFRFTKLDKSVIGLHFHRNISLTFRGLLAIGVVILCSSSATAQVGASGGIGAGGGQPVPGSANVPIYRVMKAGEITMSVNLWGFVGGPGHYDIPASTTLVELLSYAGGPTAQSRLTDIRIIHADTTYEKRVEVFNIQQYIESGDVSQNPYLLTGDTIVVSGRALDVFFQTVSIITNIMVIVTALINFISFTAK